MDALSFVRIWSSKKNVGLQKLKTKSSKIDENDFLGPPPDRGPSSLSRLQKVWFPEFEKRSFELKNVSFLNCCLFLGPEKKILPVSFCNRDSPENVRALFFKETRGHTISFKETREHPRWAMPHLLNSNSQIVFVR